MKKLLIMSMALLLGVTSSFSQVKTRTVKTVKSNSAAVDEIKQKYNAVKNEAAEVIKKETGTKNGRVTRPSSNVGTKGGYITDNDGGNDLILLKPGSTNGRVTRPSSNVGTKGGYITDNDGGNDLILLKPGSTNGRVTRPSSNVGTKGKDGVQDLVNDNTGLIKSANGKTNVRTRRGGTRRR